MSTESIPVTRKKSRLLKAFFGQQLHHRNRRLEALDRRRRRLSPVEEYNHPGQWRRRANDHKISAVPLSNCHMVLWSGPISIGTPPQNFWVDFESCHVIHERVCKFSVNFESCYAIHERVCKFLRRFRVSSCHSRTSV